ncbi:MAG: FxsA family protein [Myxococcales bacterium]|nr:FxsA family protein [Myxococcales bacterium]
MGKLFLLFTVVPFVELYLLMRIGAAVGFLPTVALVLLTGVVGAALAKAEGLRVLRQSQEALDRGELPAEGVLGGVLVLIGGVLLITPGVLTDAAGLLLLVPPVRRWVADRVRHNLEARIARGDVHVFHTTVMRGGPFPPEPGDPFGTPRRGPEGPDRTGAGTVIDVEGEEVSRTVEPRRLE